MKQGHKQLRELISNASISEEDLKEYYRRGLGELNIPLNQLLDMTIEQIDLAYEGYIRRVELNANAMKLAFCSALNHNTSLIKLRDEVSEGTLAERYDALKEMTP